MEPKTHEELILEINKLNEKIKNLENIIENKELIINQLQRYVFGSKSESIKREENIVKGEQCSIFGMPEEEKMQEEIKKETEEITVYRKKNNKKRTSGIKKCMLKNVEYETYIENVEDAKCPECKADMKKIGEEFVRQEIEFIPAKMKIKNYIRNVYKCEKCGTEGSEKDTPTIVKSHVPNAIITHSFASPSLATEVIYQKFYMGVPLYRQEKVWDDRGLILPRSMSANWCIKISEYYLSNIYKLMIKKLTESSKLLHIDETILQCNHEANRKATSKSYMWVMVSGKIEKEKGVIFHYSSSRSEEVPKKLLKNYNGIIVTDGYDGYNNIQNVIHAECWAHCRRYFYESVPLDSQRKMIETSDGYKGVQLIDELFKIEKQIEELPPEEKLKEREEKTKPVLKNFYDWVNLTSQKIITNTKLQKALTYATNQRQYLEEFMKDGRIPLTNSRAERAIRPFAVHRKNWLFADTEEGARAYAVYYSLIESAKINNLNIYKYLNYLLKELPQLEGEQTEKDLEKYLPWSKELPEEILNYQGTYEDLKLNN